MDTSNNPITAWHKVVEERDMSGLSDILADDVIFHSPVIHTPQAGKALTIIYLSAAAGLLLNGTFRYVREVVGPQDAVLEFMSEIDGITINGVDLIKWNADGKIVEFKVMIRPLKAIEIIRQKMAEMTQKI
ncbi:MAG TPA: nuclear transport factor 2 family protein [Pyrinomonadaceae bacterium]|nr:nuclear transport factor 2 family protein [Pyrinomonadaceae bacterium]